MLKSLELFGFKSFADRTRFDFGAGITGVVGPNGSGKSNVVDAIKWILGDQSPKSLRGKEMTDVIFNGSPDRKASQFAEALLTFDNSSGFLKVEAAEIQVGRRLWKNGDSEYLINRQTARRKDIIDLLMGTGAGSAAYSIIEQGRVDQILQASATSRRSIFEEAAGISRFKFRRAEALRKLERVGQHVDRLTDIVDEVEAQLNATRNQAAKAAKYRELLNELKDLWLGLAADDCRHLSARRLEQNQIVATTTGQIESISVRLETADSELTGLDDRILQLDERMATLQRNQSAAREQLVTDQSTVRHQSARVEEIDAELKRLRRQRTVMVMRLREVAEESTHNRRVLEQSERDVEECRQQLSTRQRKRDEIETALTQIRREADELRQQQLDRVRRVSQLENQIERIAEQRQELEQEQSTTEKQRSQINDQITAAAQTRDEHRVRADEAQQAVSDCETALANVETQERDLKELQDLHRLKLAEQREQRSAWQARVSLLEDLEYRQEGLSVGVKEILNRAKTVDRPPWNRIIGSVADLIEVDLENAALLEVALGMRTQLIVVHEYDAIIDYLREGHCRIDGQVAFLARFIVAPQSDNAANAPTPAPFISMRTDPPDLTGSPGVIARADSLIRSVQQVPELAGHLLADTWIVESISSAMTLWSGQGRGCRFVTLQGELLEADATLVVGTMRGETALLSRKSELRLLKNELVKLELKIADSEKQIVNTAEKMAATNRELESAMRRHRDAQSHLADTKAKLATAEQTHSQLLKRQEENANAIGSLGRQSERLDTEKQEVEEQLETAQTELHEFEIGISDAEKSIEEKLERLKALDDQQSGAGLELAKHEERLSGLQTALDRLAEEQETRIAQKDESERRFGLMSQRRRESVLQILNTTARLAETALTYDSIHDGLAELMNERDDWRLKRGKLRAEHDRLRKSQRDHEQKLHAAELELRDVDAHLNTLGERIAEEYQLTLSDVVASGVSAVETYRKERQADWDDLADSELENVSAESETAFEDVREELESQVNRLRRKLKMMGGVNTDSLRDLDELEDRHQRLSTQLQDLVEAKTALEEIIRRVNSESKRLFLESFESIRGHFQQLFRRAFGGGDGDIVLEDPNDVLECGIDIVARPPGKELQSISLMSGGEKTLTAFALLLAVFKSRPSPYCVLDEVDAALDEANVGRLTALLSEFGENTQFVVITHKKPTMTICDVLYGVTMEQAGVSTKLNVRFEDVSDNGEINHSGDARQAA